MADDIPEEKLNVLEGRGTPRGCAVWSLLR
jgi:hypothetical protein